MAIRNYVEFSESIYARVIIEFLQSIGACMIFLPALSVNLDPQYVKNSGEAIFAAIKNV